MAEWKKVLVSGSDAQLRSIIVDNTAKIKGATHAFTISASGFISASTLDIDDRAIIGKLTSSNTHIGGDVHVGFANGSSLLPDHDGSSDGTAKFIVVDDLTGKLHLTASGGGGGAGSGIFILSSSQVLEDGSNTHEFFGISDADAAEAIDVNELPFVGHVGSHYFAAENLAISGAIKIIGSITASGNISSSGHISASSANIKTSLTASSIKGKIGVGTADLVNDNDHSIIFGDNTWHTSNVQADTSFTSSNDLKYNPKSQTFTVETGSFHTSNITNLNVSHSSSLNHLIIKHNTEGTTTANTLDVLNINGEGEVDGGYFNVSQSIAIAQTTADLASSVGSTISITTNNTDNSDHFVTFVDAQSGTPSVDTDSALKYNPGQDLLTVNAITASHIGNVSTTLSASGLDVTNNARIGGNLTVEGLTFTDLGATEAVGAFIFGSGSTGTDVGGDPEYFGATTLTHQMTGSLEITGSSVKIKGPNGFFEVDNNANKIGFVGTASWATKANLADDADKIKVLVPASDAVHHLTFIAGTANGSYESLIADADLKYNSGTDTLFATNFSGNGANLTNVAATTATNADNATKVKVTSDADGGNHPLTFIDDTSPDGGNEPLKAHSELKYNPSTKTLFAGKFSGNGSSLTNIGTAAVASQLIVAANSDDEEQFITFINSTADSTQQSLLGDQGLKYNPNKNRLTTDSGSFKRLDINSGTETDLMISSSGTASFAHLKLKGMNDVSASIAAIASSGVDLTGNLTLGSDGNSTTIINGSLTVTNDLTVNDDVTINDDLQVNGNTTLGNVGVSDTTTINGSLVSTGTATMGTVTIANLTVSGQQTVINTTDLSVEDRFIYIGSGSGNNIDTGIVFGSGSKEGKPNAKGLNAIFLDNSENRFGLATNVNPFSEFGTTQVAENNINGYLVSIRSQSLNSPNESNVLPKYGFGEMILDNHGELWYYDANA